MMRMSLVGSKSSMIPFRERWSRFRERCSGRRGFSQEQCQRRDTRSAILSVIILHGVIGSTPFPNPSPQPPLRFGEGEQRFSLPLSASGRGSGGGVSKRLFSASADDREVSSACL